MNPISRRTRASWKDSRNLECKFVLLTHRQNTINEMFQRQKLYQTMVDMNASIKSPKRFLSTQGVRLDVHFRAPPKLKEEDED